MRLLLHICCAPCTIYPFEALRDEGFDTITGFFYNPNIHPYTEYINRRTALEEYSKRHNIEVIFHKYDIENYFRCIIGNEESPRRCELCWQLRLEEAASYGAFNNYNAFTTTLLVSPYQDRSKIIAIGADLAKRHNIDFIGRDFTSGFRHAQGIAKEEHLYRQKYCGCVFSERERHKKT